jgi:hypothetical protein
MFLQLLIVDEMDLYVCLLPLQNCSTDFDYIWYSGSTLYVYYYYYCCCLDRHNMG